MRYVIRIPITNTRFPPKYHVRSECVKRLFVASKQNGNEKECDYLGFHFDFVGTTGHLTQKRDV